MIYTQLIQSLEYYTLNNILCHSNDAHQRHRAGCKFTRYAYTHKRVIIRPQV